MSAAVKPYSPPRARVDDVAQADSEAEEIRQEHIKHEAAIRSVGILYYLSGGLMVLLGGSMLFSSFATITLGALGAGLSIVYAGLGVLMLFVARGVRTLQNWA